VQESRRGTAAVPIRPRRSTLRERLRYPGLPIQRRRMVKKTEPKKLSLNKETVADLKQVAGGLNKWFSDCAPCD
jgi:hypothetical protein